MVFLLFSATFVWDSTVGVGNVWTEEQAKEYADAARELHDVVNAPAHAEYDLNSGRPSSHDHKEVNVEAATARFENIEAERDHAIWKKSVGKLTLQAFAAIFAVAGICVYGFQRAKES